MSIATTTEWAVAGSYFEACNCEAICPCRSVGGRPGGRSTEGICQFTLSWMVERGHSGPLDLGDLAVVMAGFYDDDEANSPWRVVLYVDENASAAQRSALADIFLGREGGGARANYAAAIAEVQAVRPARIELEHKPGRWAIGVEGYVRVTASQLVDSDETVACGIPGTDRPGQELRADVMAVDDRTLSWEIRGRCAFATSFDYRSDSK